jgi:hypothetical protein
MRRTSESIQVNTSNLSPWFEVKYSGKYNSNKTLNSFNTLNRGNC